MIPKRIYYCWFGHNPKKELHNKCIRSWKKYCPEYEIIEVNENNFDTTENYFCNKAYKEKKWAFVSDYARLKILYENGGVYLDTDMELLKNIDIFLEKDCFLGFESITTINGAIIGSCKENTFIGECLNRYDNLQEYINIPVIITDILKLEGLSGHQNINIQGVHLYTTSYFYPVKFREKFSSSCIQENTYSIHWWETSWYPWYYKLLKKINMLGIIPILGTVKNKIQGKFQ